MSSVFYNFFNFQQKNFLRVEKLGSLNIKLEFVNQIKNTNNGFPKGASHPLVGFLGATPLNRRSQAAKYPTCANVLQSKTWKQKLAFVFRSAACEALRKSEFWGGKPQKRKSLQERDFLTAALLLLSYSDKSKVTSKTFHQNVLEEYF